MKNFVELALITYCLFLLTSCTDDMSRSRRIINEAALKNVENIALISFAINSECSIGSGEDAGSVNNHELIRDWGKFNLSYLNDHLKSVKSPNFIDLDKMINSENYKKLKFENTYLLFK